MSNEQEQISPEEARKSLDAIEKMEQIGSNRSVYPTWFHITLAVLIFLYFSTIQESGENGHLFGFAGIVLYGVMLRKVGIVPDYSRSAMWVLFCKSLPLAVFYLLVVYLRRTHILILAPYAGGLIAVAYYYVMYRMSNYTGSVQEVREEKL